MKTRLISFFIALAMILAVVPMTLAESPNFTLSVTANKPLVASGDEVEFTVSMKNADNIDGIQFKFNYDSNELKYISSSFSTEVSNVKDVSSLNSKTNYIGVIAALNEGLSGNVDICKLKFKVNNGLSINKLAISLSNDKLYSGSNHLKTEFDIADVLYSKKACMSVSSDRASYKADEIVTYDLLFTNSTVKGAQFDFDYDEEALEFDSVVFDSSFSSATSKSNNDIDGVIKVGFAFDSAVLLDNAKIQIKFKAKSLISTKSASASILNPSFYHNNNEEISIDIVPCDNISVLTVSSDTQLNITSDVTEISKDEYVEYYVNVPAGDYRGIQFSFDYDEDALDFDDVIYDATLSDALTKSDNNVDGMINVGVAFTSAKTLGGALFTIRFKAKALEADKNVVSKLENVKFSDNNNKKVDLANAGEYSIKVFTASYIKITPTRSTYVFGDEVEYKLTFGGKPIKGYQFDFEYDKDRLEYVGTSFANESNYAFTKDANKEVDGLVHIGVAFGEAKSLANNQAIIKLRVKDLEDSVTGYKPTISNCKFADAGNQDIDLPIMLDDAISFIPMYIELSSSNDVAFDGTEFVLDVKFPTVNIQGYQFSINYDSSLLDYVETDFINESFLAFSNGSNKETDGKINVSAAFSEKTEISGTQAKVKFKVKKGITAQTTILSLVDDKVTRSSNEDDKINVANVNDFALELRLLNPIVISADKAILNENDSVAFTIHFDSSLFLRGAQFEFNFDNQYLEYVDAQLPDDTVGGEAADHSEDGYISVGLAYADPTVVKDVILNFKVKTGILIDEDKQFEVFIDEGKYQDDESEIILGYEKNPVLTVVSKVKEVKELISAISTPITLDSLSDIKKAEDAYDALSQPQKDLVSNYTVLTSNRATYDRIKAVKDLIDAIDDEVTLDSNDDIIAAREAYNALLDIEKAEVTNYATLEAAEAEYKKQKDEADDYKQLVSNIDAIVTMSSLPQIEAAEEAYNKLNSSQKDYAKASYDIMVQKREAFDTMKSKVDQVKDLIGAIEEEVTLASKDKIEAARKAYDALSGTEKADVTNYATLEAAESEYKNQEDVANQYKEKVAVLTAITELKALLESEASIVEAETAYATLNDSQKDYVKDSYDVMVQKRQAYDNIRVVSFDSDGGSAVDTQYISVGERVTKPSAPTKSGYTFEGWYEDDYHRTAFDFVNPVSTTERNILAYAKWKKKSSSTGGGGGGTGGGGGSKGTKATIAVTPVVEVETEQNANADTTTNKFVDINGHWAEANINNLFEKGIVNGRTETIFDPDATVTRAEFATMLYNMLKPEKNTDSSFDDVKEGDWYFEAVTSLVATKIINGYGDGTFRPNEKITRQEMATMMAKSCDYLGIELSEESIDGFTDKDQIDDWAKPYVAKLLSRSIINGYEDNTFRPKTNTTRAHAAVVIDKTNGLIK